MANELIMISDEVDPNGFMLDPEAIGQDSGPMFNIRNFAQFFFARSPGWVRHHEREGNFMLAGVRVGDRRTSSGARVYNLGDVERCAHALAQNGVIGVPQLLDALRLVKIQARMHGMIDA